jgi:hypothetical protein
MNNKPDLLVVTPTRDRPEAFRLAVRWMKGQRFELPEPASFSWVVVDDGDKPLDLNAVGIAQHAPAPADPGAHHVYPNRILEEKNLNVHWTRRAPSAVPCTLHDNLDHFIEMLARHWPDFDGWIAI